MKTFASGKPSRVVILVAGVGCGGQMGGGSPGTGGGGGRGSQASIKGGGRSRRCFVSLGNGHGGFTVVPGDVAATSSTILTAAMGDLDGDDPVRTVFVR